MSLPKENVFPQEIARSVCSEAHKLIKVGMSEKEIETLVMNMMAEKGSDAWWYHGVGALVLLGSRTRLSIPGKQYTASTENRVQENDVISIDFAPTYHTFWGDYARTYFMENGVMAPEDKPSDPDNIAGLHAELHIHRYLTENLNPDMTYEDVFYILNEEIAKIGFVNLDFHKNLGHSVNIDPDDRTYLEKGSKITFRELGLPFTLEPHIARPESGHGYKRENIYYIDGDKFVCL